MTKRKKNRVFATGSVWSILIYLLYSDVKDVKRTHFYFIDTSIHPDIRKKFNGVTLKTKFWDNHWWRLHQFYSIFEPIVYRLRWPFLMNSEFYGIDQGAEIQAIFGRNSYTLIEDGTKDYIINRKISTRPFEKLRNFLWGPINGHDFGNNDSCKKIILTQKPTNEYLVQKGEQIDLRKCWEESSEEKQELILNLFSITPSDIKMMSSKSVLLLTQPISEDKACTESDKIRYYKEIIDCYGEGNVLIKTHPREKTKYQEIFPQTVVFDKIVPMQLFCIIGLSFKVVATICSTAALIFANDVNTKLDFRGTSRYPEVLKIYGKVELSEIL
jgi:hypothetical protein